MPTKAERTHNTNLRTTLKKLCDSFSSYDEMARRLRLLDTEFSTVDRSTISRWCNATGSLPRRARKAIQVLQKVEVRTVQSVRVVLSSSAINLPLLLACLPQKDGRKGSLLEQYGISPELRFTETGAQAVHLLLDGQAGLAIAGHDVLPLETPVREAKRNVKRLCHVGSRWLHGKSTKPLRSKEDFIECVFAFPSATSVEGILTTLLLARAHPDPKPFGLSSPEHGLQWILEQEGKRPDTTLCIVAWQEWFDKFDHLERTAKTPKTRKRKFWEVNQYLLGQEKFDLYFNDQLVHPGVVRGCLACLEQITASKQAMYDFLGKADFTTGFQRLVEEGRLPSATEIPQAFQSVSVLKEVITEEDAEFSISDVDVDLLLALWAREVNEARQHNPGEGVT